MVGPTLTKQGYRLADGRTLPRVSTILATIAKPGLEAWRQRVGVEEAARVSAVATELGTRVHAACELINRGPLPIGWIPPLDVAPFADAYAEWFQQHVAEVVAAERVVYSARLGYAGTLDLLARLHDGRLALCDIKTGKSVDGLARLQLAAYACALEEQGEPPVDTRLVVHLPSNAPGTLRIVEYDEPERDRLTWRALVAVYHWWQARKDDWKVQP